VVQEQAETLLQLHKYSQEDLLFTEDLLHLLLTQQTPMVEL
jgi:hypothetical protein